jgi:uncharacterized protein (TIGR02301 family)
MERRDRRSLRLLVGLLAAAWASMAFAPSANAQFFWWFDQPKETAKPRPKPKPPGDDLPPIVPRESTLPPPPDDRPYDNKLLRLAEILGAIHYLRELCGAQEGQVWRDQMQEILRNEATTAVRRAKLVNAFNDGYRGYRRTYRTCTQSATLATTRFSAEGATIAEALAQSSVFASKGGPKDVKSDAAPSDKGTSAPGADQTGAAQDAAKGASQTGSAGQSGTRQTKNESSQIAAAKNGGKSAPQAPEPSGY